MNAIEKAFSSFGQKEGILQKIIDGNTTSTLRNHLTGSHPHVNLRPLEMGKNDPERVGQRGRVRKIVEMEKIPTSSKGIMQAFTHLGKLYDPKSRNQLQF